MYYGTYPREVEHVGLGYGTRLSGYTTLDPAEDRCFPEAGPQKTRTFLPVKERSWVETQPSNSIRASSTAQE
jgi:hypothetical protein